jgi:3-isopropylmalate/(R)-2-methylmalate dehydratase large subunit
MTIIERILARKAGFDEVRAGDTVTVDVDMTVLIDLQFAAWPPNGSPLAGG